MKCRAKRFLRLIEREYLNIVLENPFKQNGKTLFFIWIIIIVVIIFSFYIAFVKKVLLLLLISMLLVTGLCFQKNESVIRKIIDKRFCEYVKKDIETLEEKVQIGKDMIGLNTFFCSLISPLVLGIVYFVFPNLVLNLFNETEAKIFVLCAVAMISISVLIVFLMPNYKYYTLLKLRVDKEKADKQRRIDSFVEAFLRQYSSQVKDIAIECMNDESVNVYYIIGSLNRNSVHSAYDVAVAIEYRDGNYDGAKIDELRKCIEKADIPYRVQVIDMRYISFSARQEISKLWIYKWFT